MSDTVLWWAAGLLAGALVTYFVMDWRRGLERSRHVDQLLDLNASMSQWQGRQDERAMQTPLPEALAAAVPPFNEVLYADYREMTQRLMDAALPKREVGVGDAVDGERPGSPAEYDPPVDEVGDWTDPFFGLERELVGGLRPGQGIPGIGQPGDLINDPMLDGHVPGDLSYGLDEFAAAVDEVTLMRDGLDDHPLARGFTPDDDAPREGWADRGEEMFEAWEEGRTT